MNLSINPEHKKRYKKYIAIFIMFFTLSASSSIFGEYNAGDYYFCEDSSGGGISGIFGIQQRNGTISDPNNYDPKQPSREYMYVMYSSYPYPFGYVPIIAQSEKEIFLQGSHLPFQTQSKKEEPFSFVINKETLLMTGTLMDYEGNSYRIDSKCCKSFIEAKYSDDGTYQPRTCK